MLDGSGLDWRPTHFLCLIPAPSASMRELKMAAARPARRAVRLVFGSRWSCSQKSADRSEGWRPASAGDGVDEDACEDCASPCCSEEVVGGGGRGIPSEASRRWIVRASVGVTRKETGETEGIAEAEAAAAQATGLRQRERERQRRKVRMVEEEGQIEMGGAGGPSRVQVGTRSVSSSSGAGAAGRPSRSSSSLVQTAQTVEMELQRYD